MSIDSAFNFSSPQSKALAAIDSTKYPDTNKDLQANLIRLNQFVDYIAQYLQIMQKGIDKNNQDPIAQIQGVASDLVVLLGGGELLYGIDLGDLQYFLPAIGALLGFDTTTPFPINLFNAAEHFFLGYVVPLDSFATVIEGIIDGWAVALGIDQSWIDAINELLDALGGIETSLQDFFQSIQNLLNIFGTDFPFISHIWKLITTILGGFSLDELGAILDPAFKAAAPWIDELADAVNYLNQIIESFSGGVTNLQGILNFSSLFSTINFLPATGGFHPIPALTSWIQGSLKPTNLLAFLSTDLTGGSSMGLTGVIPLENLALDAIASVIGGAQSLIDAILAVFGFPAGSGTENDVAHIFQNIYDFLGNPVSWLEGAVFDATATVTNFINTMLHPTNLLVPMNPSTLLANPVNIPSLGSGWAGTVDGTRLVNQIAASLLNGSITNATLPGSQLSSAITNQNYIPSLTSAWTGTLAGARLVGSVAGSLISGAITSGSMAANLITSGTFVSGVLLPGSQLASAITNQNYIPALTSAWTGNLDGSKLVGAIAGSLINGALTNASMAANLITSGTFVSGVLLPGSQLASAITNQNYIPTLTSAWTGNLDGSKLVGAIAGSLLSGSITSATLPAAQLSSGAIPAAVTIGGNQLSSAITNQQYIPNLTSGWSGTLDGSRIIGQIAASIINGILAPAQIPPLDASIIQSGQFGQWVLPNIPLGSIGQTLPNLLPNPNYATSGSIASNPDWVWDGTAGNDHTGDGSGSAKCVCNGNLHTLMSDPPTPVAPNQTLALSHYLKWSGVTGSGACFQLGIAYYNGPNLQGTTILQSITNPAASGAYQQLSGTYTVPASGVDNVRLVIQVTAAATAGTTNWDDGSITKTQLLFKQWMQGTGGTLVNELASMVTDTGTRATQSDMTKLLDNLGAGSFSGNITNALSAITSRLVGVSAGGLLNAGNIDPATMINHPNIDAGKVASGILGTARIPPITLGMAPDLQQLNDNATNALIGAQTLLTGTTTAQANSSMQSIFTNVLYNTQALQQQAAANQGAAVSGVSITVNFASYPDGSMPSFFTVIESGPGTSHIGIKGGLAGWFPAVNDGTRTAFVIYNAQATNTDWQRISGSMSAAPGGSNAGGQPYFYALGRVDNPSNPQNYVFGRAYCTGFLTYKADVGYCVNGVETVGAFGAGSTGIALTWSTAMMVVIGANGNARTFQVFSGTQLVWSGTEVGTNSKINNGTTDPVDKYRYFGAKNTICQGSGGSSTAGTLSGTSVSDNAPPTVLGSTFRAHRASTTAYSAPSGGLTALPAGFFDTQDWKSPDMTWDGQNLKFTIEGTYLVNLRAAVNNIPRGVWADLGIVGSSIRVVGGSFADTGTSAQSNNGVYGSTLIYAHNGDSIQPATYASAAFSIVGEPGGSQTYMEVTLVNRSTV
jgi:hypothetical protein